jgi:hypothetical protein
MRVEEEGAWNHAPTIRDSAAGQAGGVNDPTLFANDFVAGGPCDAALGLVISDDPFFRANHLALMTQIRNWLAPNPNRYVIYPSQAYGPLPHPPYPAQGAIFGPDLLTAYQTLGNLARDAYNGLGVGWVLL